jgi:DNA-binding MarR family transcriptional regulator
MSESIDQLIYEVRVFYQSLLQIGDVLHEESGISMGMRAVMEYLLKRGPSTVPQIAKDRRVTRQRIQILVNQLIDQSLVDVKENPATKRSPLVTLRSEGKKAIAGMKKKESKLIKRSPITDIESRDAMLVLRRLRESLESNVSRK